MRYNNSQNCFVKYNKKKINLVKYTSELLTFMRCWVGFEFQCGPGGQFFYFVKCLDSFPNKKSILPAEYSARRITWRFTHPLINHVGRLKVARRTFPAKADQSGARQHAYEHAHAIVNSKINNR